MHSWLHRVIFFTGITSVAITYVTCFTILKTMGWYSRDIFVPFFSDIGRDSINYYIFVVGLSIAGLFQLFTPCYVYYHVIRPKLAEVDRFWLSAVAGVALACSLVSALFLPGIAIFPFSGNTHHLHCYIAKSYFAATLVSQILYAVLYYGLYHSVTNVCPWKASVRTWGIRRLILLAIAFPYFPQTLMGVDSRRISYDEAQSRLEHSTPAIADLSAFENPMEYEWRRKNGKALSDPYEGPIEEEFERIPVGEPKPVVRMTSLYSYANCKLSGYLLTLNQPVSIFAMTFATTSFYFDFVASRKLKYWHRVA